MIFTELYNKADKKAYEDMAMEYLVNDTLRDKLRGAEKSKQLTGMHMEDTFNKDFIPTMAYTFLYNSPEPVSTVYPSSAYGKTNEGHKFLDRVPCILCMEVTDDMVGGINFNLMPNNIRALVLDSIYETFRDFYKDKLSQAVAEDKAVVNEDFGRLIMTKPGRDAFLFYLNNKCGVQVTGAYRRYKKDMMADVRLLEYDTWQYIPFLAFKDAIRGAGLAVVQTEMTKNQTNK